MFLDFSCLNKCLALLFSWDFPLLLFSSCILYLELLLKIQRSGVGVENSRNFLCQHYARVGFPLHLSKILLMSQTTLYAEFINLLNILRWMLILFTKVTC